MHNKKYRITRSLGYVAFSCDHMNGAYGKSFFGFLAVSKIGEC